MKKCFMKKPIPKAIKVIIVAVIWIAIWEVVCLIVGKELIVPSPFHVFMRVFALAGTGVFWGNIGTSLLRILIGYLMAVVLGVFVGVLTAKVAFLDSFLTPAAKVIRATPVVSFIILLFVFAARNHIPVITVFLMVLPVVWANVYEGIKSTDPKLLEMAKAFDLKKGTVFKKIYFPQILPFFKAAVKTGIGLAWKAGIAAEVIVNPKYGIGTALHDSKVYIETTDLFAWTVVVIIISMILEKILVRLIEKAGRETKRA